MLSEPRVKEAEKNVRNYLDDGLLKKQPFRKEIFAVLQRNAQESLDVADFISRNGKSDLWVVVTSYYSMYYIANAVLYRLGYKVGDRISHKVTSDALIVFARSKLKDGFLEGYEEAKDEALAGMKADLLLEDFDSERKKRHLFQYETQELEKRSKARISLERAKGFLFEMEKLLAGLK